MRNRQREIVHNWKVLTGCWQDEQKTERAALLHVRDLRDNSWQTEWWPLSANYVTKPLCMEWAAKRQSKVFSFRLLNKQGKASTSIIPCIVSAIKAPVKWLDYGINLAVTFAVIRSTFPCIAIEEKLSYIAPFCWFNQHLRVLCVLPTRHSNRFTFFTSSARHSVIFSG